MHLIVRLRVRLVHPRARLTAHTVTVHEIAQSVGVVDMALHSDTKCHGVRQLDTFFQLDVSHMVTRDV